MATPTRRQFTDAFKPEAVRLTRESGRPVAQVAGSSGFLTMCCIGGGVNSSRSNPKTVRAGRCAPCKTNWPSSSGKMKP